MSIISHILSPRSVAVVGASTDSTKIAEHLDYLKRITAEGVLSPELAQKAQGVWHAAWALASINSATWPATSANNARRRKFSELRRNG